MYACGVTNSCSSGKKCNCYNGGSGWREDSGLLTDKSALPVSQIKLSDLNDPGDQGYHTLGKLKYYGLAWDILQKYWDNTEIFVVNSNNVMHLNVAKKTVLYSKQLHICLLPGHLVTDRWLRQNGKQPTRMRVVYVVSSLIQPRILSFTSAFSDSTFEISQTAWKLKFDSILFWIRAWAWFSIEHA